MRNEGAFLLLPRHAGDKITEGKTYAKPSVILSPLVTVLVIDATARNGRHFMLTK
jgi:hypothetical protein